MCNTLPLGRTHHEYAKNSLYASANVKDLFELFLRKEEEMF